MASEEATDFELLEQWRGGDEAAGRQLFARYFDSVYRFFRNKVDDAAEDLTQQAFMGLVQGRDRFRGDASFRTYIFMIARKRLYSYLRKAHRGTDSLDAEQHSVADLGLLSPSKVVANRQEQKLLLRALRTLPLDMQVALELFYWEELTVTEIGDVLETPIGTVKSRLQRARARLDVAIAELADSEALRQSTMDNFDRWAKDLQAQLRPPRSKPDDGTEEQ